MLKTIILSTIVAFSGILAAIWGYNEYTLVGHSLVSKDTFEKINQYGQFMAMQGYMAGAQEGAESCKSHT